MSIAVQTKKWFQEAVDLLFPIQCLGCEKHGEYLCSDCKSQLIPHPEICPYCHKPSQDFQTCWHCKLQKEFALDGLIMTFSYTSIIKKLILKLKYQHKKELAEFLAERLKLAYITNQSLKKTFEKNNPTDDHNTKVPIITFIPSHRYKKRFVKGYNQAEILASHLSEKTGFPLIPLLKKTHQTSSQVKLQREQRFINIKGKFQKNENIQLRGQETIIIVDDITTTGATLNEAAKTLKYHYPQLKIRGLVIGRHN